MSYITDGYELLAVELLSWTGDDLAKMCWDFGKHGEFYTHTKEYNKDDNDCIDFVTDIIKGRTFPKYIFEGITLSFKVNNISRICLAQFTREKGIFCSQSGGVRPLTNVVVLPKAIHNNPEFLHRYKNILTELEKLYVDLAKAGHTYLDSRYIMPHGQVIDIAYSTKCIDFMKSCCSRTRNNLGDEINMVYRRMRYELIKRVEEITDDNSTRLWNWLLSMSFPKGPYTRDCTYCNGFEEYPIPEGFEFPETAHEDWRNSSWKLELEHLYEHAPYLLTWSEYCMVESWKDGNLQSNYDKNAVYTFWKSVECMSYYRGSAK